MSTASRPITDPPAIDDGAEGELTGPMADWYDRSSMVGDFMVMIADQTEEEYLRRAPENKVCEFIDGTVYMPSPVTLWHQFEVQFLAVLLEMFTARRRAGIVLTGPAAIKLRPDCFLEPDIFVLPPGGEAQFHGVYCDPPALLVVEVLSKSTRSHDLNLKRDLYREAGVLEVWFVDDRDKVLIVHRRGVDGDEVERIESGPYHSRVLPGFWFEVSWLWARPRPDLYECMQIILAGPPA